jgi:hypothetical protein
MGFLDLLTPKSRKWRRHSRSCQDTMMRAAAVQGRSLGLNNPMPLAVELVNHYSLNRKQANWQEFGEVAFHLLAQWPPDLAYVILYGLREVKAMEGRDVVPFVLKAVEMMPHFNPTSANMRLTAPRNNPQLLKDSNERARSAAKLLAREISNVPLRWASGIYRSMDGTTKPFVAEQLKAYNPVGAAILLSDHGSWLLTKSGVLKGLMRMLFGRGVE